MSPPSLDFPEFKAPIQEVSVDSVQNNNIRLFIKREDLSHPQISGNKWRKLKYNLLYARDKGFNTLLTFGGAHSNHIYATAAAGKLYGFNTIGIIRGDELTATNETLKFAASCGMQLLFVDRESYRNKHNADFLKDLENKFGQFYHLPEGGTNNLAIKGCEEILSPGDYNQFDYICCCCGTGGTISGIISASAGKSTILGFSVLKGGFMKNEVSTLLQNYNNYQYSNWQIIEDYHLGGYGKKTALLLTFIEEFSGKTGIPLEFVYTGKLIFGIFELLKKDFFKSGTKILAIHTGGLR